MTDSTIDDGDTEINRLRTELAQCKHQARATFESIDDGISIINADGIVQYTNTKALDYLSLEADEINGRHFMDVTSRRLRVVGEGEVKPRLKDFIDQVFRTGEMIKIDSLSVEYLDGQRTLDFAITISPIKSEEGEIASVLVHFRDISKLVQLNRMKDTFISTVSHELRTPISVIAGYVDLLLDPADSLMSGKQRHYLERANEATEALIQTINNLLDINRLESGQREDKPIAIEIQPFLENIVENKLSLFASKPLGLHLQTNPATIYVDYSRLKHVIDNLLSNAYKYTPENGEVLIASHVENDNCIIEIIDNGPGIAPEHTEDVFEHLIKTKDGHSTYGAGLGLAIAKHIVDNWGGEIKVENVPTGGAKFYFTAPLVSENNKSSGENT